MVKSIAKIEPFGKHKHEVNAIVETPKGSGNKFDYDPDLDLFELGTAMPEGVVFPFEFGFIPNTLGDDGDPLDLLILMDSPSFPGCFVKARLIGVIEAEQSEKGHTIRNDRLIAVAICSRRHEGFHHINELPCRLVDEIEYFFISYNRIKGREFTPIGRFGPKRATRLVTSGIKRASKQ